MSKMQGYEARAASHPGKESEDPGAPGADERAQPSSHGRRQLIRAVGTSALSRLLVLPLSAVLGIVVTRLVIDNYGQDAYVQYALLVGVVALIPFADLGITASIMNATGAAADPRSDEHLRLTLVSCLRVLVCCSLFMIGLATAFTVTDSWGALLGRGLMADTGSLAAGLCLGVLGVTLLVSYGQRILMGLGRNHWVILINGMQTPLVLATLCLVLWIGVDIGPYVAVISYVATFGLALICLALAARLLGSTLARAYHDAWRLRTVRGARIFDTALPMLVQMVALPLAMQSDRLMLSHTSTVDELASYSLAAQMFNPFVAVVSAASVALWPVFARARAEGTRSAVSPFALSAVFAAVAGVVVMIVGLASGMLADLASGSTIDLSVLLVVSFATLVVVQAAKFPVGMYLTDAAGLRFQAYMVIPLLGFKLALSFVLAGSMGAAGPVIASVLAVALFQVVPNALYVRRRLSVEAGSPAAGALG